MKICCQLFPKVEKDFDEIPVEIVPQNFLIINLHNLVSGGAGKAHIKGIYSTAEDIEQSILSLEGWKSRASKYIQSFV